MSGLNVSVLLCAKTRDVLVTTTVTLAPLSSEPKSGETEMPSRKAMSVRQSIASGPRLRRVICAARLVEQSRSTWSGLTLSQVSATESLDDVSEAATGVLLAGSPPTGAIVDPVKP